MPEMKRIILGLMALTFVAGLGAGTWIQSLLAAPATQTARLDRRVQDFQQHFELSAQQIRVLRGILQDYDSRAGDIRNRMTADQRNAIDKLQEESRDRIRLMLDEAQRNKYDEMTRRK